MRDLMLQFSNNIFIEILMLAICADTLLGVLRAIKFRQFNSSVGIDGAIRKLAEKMIDAIVKVMKPSTGITYNRGVVKKTQSNGADWYGVIRGAVSVFFVKHFSLKKASEFPVFSEGFSLL